MSEVPLWVRALVSAAALVRESWHIAMTHLRLSSRSMYYEQHGVVGFVGERGESER